tara:strand:- start:1126 stop:1374 length:249 start_codon:yes stop_codon:yes gene_type:complete
MEDLWPLIVATAFGAAIVVMGRNYFRKEKKNTEKSSTDNAIGIAGETIRETFNEAIGKIKADVEGEDPAGDLADQGNARRRG